MDHEIGEFAPAPRSLGVFGRKQTADAKAEIAESEIFQLAAQQRWDLLELKRVGMTLEEVFIRVVAGEESEEAPVDKVSAEGTAS